MCMITLAAFALHSKASSFRSVVRRSSVFYPRSSRYFQPHFKHITPSTMASGSSGNDELLQAIKRLEDNMEEKMATMKRELVVERVQAD